jgi:hypothetical protein
MLRRSSSLQKTCLVDRSRGAIALPKEGERNR